MRRGSAMLVAAALVLAVVLGGPTLVRLITDWYWFDALGYDVVFRTALITRLGLGLGAGLLAVGFFYGNLKFAQRGMVPDPVVVRLGDRNSGVDLTRTLRRLALPAALGLGALVGFAASGAWLVVLAFLHRTPFGLTDPVFGRDVAYYVFTVPALVVLHGFVIGAAMMALLVVLPLYILRRDVVLLGRRVAIEPSAERHLAALIAVLFVAVGTNAWFVRLPSLLHTASGPLFGANYADLAINIPAIQLAAVTALAGAALVVWGVRTHRLARNAVVASLLYVAVSGVLGPVAAAATQKLVVDPNELVKETPQLEHHIAATRRAWGLEKVQVRDLSGDATLSLADIRRNAGTIRNVRLWDREPLLQTFGQLQAIRTYYDFVSVDDDRYWIDGEYRQVLLAPRELNTASLPTRTFINERLTFTHGMGLTLSPVNLVTQEGLPVLFIKDLPPVSSVSLQVTRPALYYGELTSDYVFVNTRQREFDFPAGDENAFTAYEGGGGVPVVSSFRKMLFSMRFGSLKVLLSDDIGAESRVLYYRPIRERVRKALPFLRWDSDPYLVIAADGALKWILDAYTTTDRYPYSQPAADGTNYMRNSVKVVLDAYDGSLVAYAVDPADPILQTYDRVFPGIFKPLDDMPPDLRAHIRYPDDLFRIQTALYTTYHMNEPDVFYHREDQWQIPVLSRQGSGRDPFLRHMVMKLPEEQSEEYILMTPFTPRQKENLAAWMVARNDGAHFGELIVYRFPRQSLVFGPSQIVNRINQDTEISRQVSLWDQRGSEVIRGNLLVIPIEESLIFVQALYLRAEGGRIPELKRVIVAYQNQVVMEETLEQGLERLFGGVVGGAPRTVQAAAVGAPAPAPTVAAAAQVADLVRQAAERYDQALAAQRAGDWATYGERMRNVGDLLRRLRELAGGGS